MTRMDGYASAAATSADALKAESTVRAISSSGERVCVSRALHPYIRKEDSLLCPEQRKTRPNKTSVALKTSTLPSIVAPKVRVYGVLPGDIAGSFCRQIPDSSVVEKSRVGGCVESVVLMTMPGGANPHTRDDAASRTICDPRAEARRNGGIASASECTRSAKARQMQARRSIWEIQKNGGSKL